MGSGGGGGSSGKVDFPDYMKTFHGDFLGTDSAVITLTAAMNSAMSGVSPYASYVGVDVSAAMLGSGVAITNFTSPFAYLNTYAQASFATLLAEYKASNDNGISTFLSESNSKIDDILIAEGAILEDDLNQTTIPAFKAGFRNVNAVMSSAFVIGEAILRSNKTKALAKEGTVLRSEALRTNAELVLKNETLCFEYATKVILSKRDIATTAADFVKLYTGLKLEADDADVEMAAKDALWDLKVFQYGGNFLGSISGSAVSTDSGKGSKLGSVFSGAMGGAAMGFMVGGPMGAGIGAAAGGLAGLLG